MDLTNLDVVIDDKDKALILLSSLPNEGYETFVLVLINGRTFLSYKEVTIALMNLELRSKDTESSFGDTSADILTVGRASPNQRRGNQRAGKSLGGSRQVQKNQCVNCN